jgi:hypothetical protein
MTKPARRQPLRYRMDALPIEGAAAREWNPPQLQLADPAAQGILPFSDGSQLGPLFTTTTTTD